MKVTVKHFIHVRIGKPSVNARTFQHVAPGTVLEVDGKLYKGDRFEGIDTWLKDGASNYYWSGGIHDFGEVSLQETVAPSAVKFNYNKLVPIPDQFRNTKGDGVVVAIVDTGCFRHKALGDAITSSFDVFTKKENKLDLSSDGHGTFLAGLIAAREDASNEIYGVAPLVKLVIVRAVERDAVLGGHVADGLKWLLDNNIKPDIINLSVNFGINAELQTKLSPIFATLVGQGTIIVAAGQDGASIYGNEVFYPASHPSVLGIGCLSKSELKNAPVNSGINNVVQDFNFYATENFPNSYRNLRGSSMSTAFVSGALALVRSWQKKNQNAQNTVALLNSHLPNLTPENFDGTLKIYEI